MNGGGEIVTTRSFDKLIEEISSLPADEKAELVSKLLGERPGVSVVFGNGANHVNKADLVSKLLGERPGVSVIFWNGANHVNTADLVVQINSADKELIEGITSAIARRIER